MFPMADRLAIAESTRQERRRRGNEVAPDRNPGATKLGTGYGFAAMRGAKSRL